MGSVGFFILMSAVGGLMIYRGLDAVRTKRFRGKWGIVYTGATAVWFGRTFLLLGPFLIIGTFIKTVIELT